jgi:hypothetical protein
MKKSILFASAVALLLLSALSQAAVVCFQNEPGATFNLSIKPACSAANPKPAAVIGTRTFASAQCLGSGMAGIHGVCFGVPSEGKVHLNLISERIDHNDPVACSLQSWNLIGDDLTLLTGSVERKTDPQTFFGASTFTRIPCP